jgi:6-phosphogluconate dehydrogenase (decarboxylating)
MQLGMIGLGPMGGNRVVRLIKAGHECVVYDTHATAVQGMVGKGARARFTRLSSRGAEPLADKLTSAMRHEFGGHAEKPTAKTGHAR